MFHASLPGLAARTYIHQPVRHFARPSDRPTGRSARQSDHPSFRRPVRPSDLPSARFIFQTFQQPKFIFLFFFNLQSWKPTFNFSVYKVPFPIYYWSVSLFPNFQCCNFRDRLLAASMFNIPVYVIVLLRCRPGGPNTKWCIVYKSWSILARTVCSWPYYACKLKY